MVAGIPGSFGGIEAPTWPCLMMPCCRVLLPPRPTSLIQRLKFNPYEGKRRGMVRVPSSSTKVHCEAKLALLKREHGITLR